MFGEVGGLNDFLSLGLSSLIGIFSERFMRASLIQKLFRGANTDDKPPRNQKFTPFAIFRSIGSLMFPTSFVIAQIFSFGRCPRDQGRRRREFEAGIVKLEYELDVVHLIRNSRALSTLLRLLLSKDDRRLLRL